MSTRDGMTGVYNHVIGKLCYAMNLITVGGIIACNVTDYRYRPFQEHQRYLGPDVGDEAIVALTRQLQITLRVAM